MSRSSKAMIGVLSFLPIVSLAVFLAMFFRMFSTFFQWDRYEPAPQEVFSFMAPIFALSIIMSLVSIALLVIFIIHLVENKTIDSTERIVWILVFIFAGIVGFPIYWYMRIWKNEQGSL